MKDSRAPTILGKPRNSARSENLYGTPYRRAHGALALFDGAKQSGQADFRRVCTGSPQLLHRFQPHGEWFHCFRNFKLTVLFRYLWRLTLGHFYHFYMGMYCSRTRVIYFFRRRSEEYGYIFSSKSESCDLRTPLLLKLNGEDFFEIAKVESEISRSSEFLSILSNSIKI